MNKDQKTVTKNSEKNTDKNIKLKTKLLSRVGHAALSLVSGAIVIGAAAAPTRALDAAEAAQEVLASEGVKEAINEALKIARSKPALTLAAGITCAACIPVAGAAASPGLCIACGILLIHKFG